MIHDTFVIFQVRLEQVNWNICETSQCADNTIESRTFANIEYQIDTVPTILSKVDLSAIVLSSISESKNSSTIQRLNFYLEAKKEKSKVYPATKVVGQE